MASILALMVPSPDDTANKKRLVRDTFVEFVATTLFVWGGTCGATSTGYWTLVDDPNGGGTDVARILPIAFCFGISIMALAFSIGHLTGGNMNPGVSLMLFFKRQMSFTKMICYWAAQFLGALLGAALTWGCISGLHDLKDGDGVLGSPPFTLGSTTKSADITTGNGFLIEFMGSFFFYFVIAQTACDKRGAATSMFPPIPIGFVLIVVHVCLIPFTGCGVNPARTLGPSMVTCMADNSKCDVVANQDWYFIYFIGPFLASFAVAEVTLWMEWDVDAGESGEEEKEEDAEAVEEPTKE